MSKSLILYNDQSKERLDLEGVACRNMLDKSDHKMNKCIQYNQALCEVLCVKNFVASITQYHITNYILLRYTVSLEMLLSARLGNFCSSQET